MLKNTCRILFFTGFVAGLSLGASGAHALDALATPFGETVVGGSSSFDRPAAGLLSITSPFTDISSIDPVNTVLPRTDPPAINPPDTVPPATDPPTVEPPDTVPPDDGSLTDEEVLQNISGPGFLHGRELLIISGLPHTGIDGGG